VPRRAGAGVGWCGGGVMGKRRLLARSYQLELELSQTQMLNQANNAHTHSMGGTV